MKIMLDQQNLKKKKTLRVMSLFLWLVQMLKLTFDTFCRHRHHRQVTGLLGDSPGKDDSMRDSGLRVVWCWQPAGGGGVGDRSWQHLPVCRGNCHTLPGRPTSRPPSPSSLVTLSTVTDVTCYLLTSQWSILSHQLWLGQKAKTKHIHTLQNGPSTPTPPTQ